ncbi:hypothetical protein [Sandaracinus amylolyticus]|uniref:hypothetical protein n=1 Tax=Sandaracinus amylolyticus TaxID=927083 RepID=UPI001F176579|nr:hypothetical protein [Sandaracinus amylolyticus]UJR82823.1 Hypothetical protein I5071_48880 [Sandaracinus amylolyticus]
MGTTHAQLLDEIREAAARGDLAIEARRAYAAVAGDPHGRFVALQLDRLERGGWPSEEEKSLLRAHWRTWVGAASTIVSPLGAVFLAGFFHECTFFEAEAVEALRDSAEVVAAPEWATVRTLRSSYVVGAPLLREILSGPLHRSVRVVSVDTASSLAALAEWRGPALRLDTLVFSDWRDADAPLATSFPGLPGLRRLRVALQADSPIDTRRTIDWLLDGPAGARGELPELELDVGIGDRYFGRALAALLTVPDRVRSPALRTLELYDCWSLRVQFERDDEGPWTRLRIRWLPAWHQRHLPVEDVRRLASFARPLPRASFADVVVEVPIVSTAAEVEAELLALVRELGARLERPPGAPYPARELSPGA